MNLELLVLVPLLLLAVVGLLAFAGCEPFDAAEPEPQPEPEPVPDPVRPSYREVVRNEIGLVAYWPLDDPDGIVVARDIGPATLNGTYVDGPPDVQRSKPGGAVAARDPQDRCAGFPGAAGHVSVPYSPTLNPASMLRFSFEVWARLRDPASRVGESEHLASSRLFAAPGSPNSGWDLFVTYGPGGVPTFTARVFSGNGQMSTAAAAVAQSATTPADGAWHHVVLTYDGTGAGTVGVHVRVAGEPQLFPRIVTPAPYVPNPRVALTFGAALTVEPFNLLLGDLDEAAFYNVVLTADRIEAHHRAAQPSP